MIVLDVGCYRELLDPSLRHRVLASARSAGRSILPSQANVFEILRYQNSFRRQQLLEVVRELKGETPLLPWPDHLLAGIATALSNGQSRFHIVSSWADEVVTNPSSLKREQIDDVTAFLVSEETKSRDAAKQGRKAARAIMKTRRNMKPFESAQDFLSVWTDDSNLRRYLDHDLSSIGLIPSEQLCGALLANPEWRLHYDIVGVAMYRQMMAPQDLRWVGRVDMAQVVYLGRASILVSRDKPMLEAAHEAVTGRYQNKRIMSWEEFLAQAY